MTLETQATQMPVQDFARAEFDWAVCLNGLGRVPVIAGSKVGVPVYDHRSWTTTFSTFDIETGYPSWTTKLDATAYTRPASDGSRFYVGFGPTRLAALDVSTGEIAWIFDCKKRIRSSPIIDDSCVIIGVANELFILDCVTGGVVRKAEFSNLFFFGRAEICRSIIVVHASATGGDQGPENCVCAFDRASLRLIWKTRVGAPVVPSSDTAGISIADSTVFCGSMDGYVSAVDVTTGKITKRTAIDQSCVRSAVVIDNATASIVATSPGCAATVLNRDDGSIRYRLDSDYEGAWSPCGIWGNLALVHAGPYLRFFDVATGSAVAHVPVGYSAYTAPVVANDRVFVCGGDPPDFGYLYCVSKPSSAKPLASYSSMYDSVSQSLHLELDVSDALDVEKIEIDARFLGGKIEEMNRVDGRRYLWSRRACRSVLHSRWAPVLRLYLAKEGEVRLTSCAFDVGSRDMLPRSVVLNVESEIQETPVSSGPAAIKAALRHYGIRSEQNDILAMGDWIISNKSLDSHHKWRGGSLRIFHSSSRSELSEMEDD
jgi:outer membrane protein assembly factor BamB